MDGWIWTNMNRWIWMIDMVGGGYGWTNMVGGGNGWVDMDRQFGG